MPFISTYRIIPAVRKRFTFTFPASFGAWSLGSSSIFFLSGLKRADLSRQKFLLACTLRDFQRATCLVLSDQFHGGPVGTHSFDYLE